ncbi:chaperonin 10-like protein [Amylostereum chailletii]|nr:chaperonin 10-like protein [Amylostereum chailletii]
MSQMRAVVYSGPFQVDVHQVDKAKLEHPNDAILKVTTTCICGSDLHMYEGRTPIDSGMVFGHEIMGIVDEIGTAVTTLKKGDRVVLPFNVACGHCRNCEEGDTALCLQVNPGAVSALHPRYAMMGPYRGGQAEYVRVPFADFNALKLPPGTEHEDDFALLSDVFPTGWDGVELSGFKSGESIAIFGAGPVGLMAAHSAHIRGASEIYVVDRVPERLQLVKTIGCIPIDFTKGDPAEQVKKLRGGLSSSINRRPLAVGYQAQGADGKTEQPSAVLEGLFEVVRAAGGIGIPGVYIPQDPGVSDSGRDNGYLLLPFGKVFQKGLHIRAGQCSKHNRYLRDLIIAGIAKPSFIVSHRLPLDDAKDAYDKFDKRIDGYTKVLLHP